LTILQRTRRCAGVFDVDRVTGAIRNKKDLATLAADYEMVVQAVDDGTPAMSSTAYVTITVLSSINEPPRWINPQTDDFILYVREVRTERLLLLIFIGNAVRTCGAEIK